MNSRSWRVPPEPGARPLLPPGQTQADRLTELHLVQFARIWGAPESA